jgi:glycosyltransferase involved in cell wall biosynthesis
VLYESGVGKRVLREVAYRYLPRDLVDLPKQGFGLPMSEWARRSLIEVCSTLVEGEDSRLGAALGPDAIARFMRRQRSASGFSAYQVWALAMLESWLRHHRAQTPRELFEPTVTVATAPTVEVFQTTADGAEPAPLMLWSLARGVVVVIEDPMVRLDLAVGTGTSAAVLMQLVQLMLACEVTLDPDELRIQPIEVASWHVLASGRCPRSVRRVVDGATILCPQTNPSGLLSSGELEFLRALGVARLVAPHPHRGDGAVFVLELKPQHWWRDRMNRRRLAKFAVGQSQLTAAGLREGEMRVAGPLPGVPSDETEMSDRFLLFEGTRQLPPLPSSHDDVQRFGGGRYSVWSRHAYFSRIGRSRSPMWAVALDETTRNLVPYVPRIAFAPPETQLGSFFADLNALLNDASDSDYPNVPKRGDRIVVLTHALPPGGAERQWCYLALELKRRGYDVCFVTVFPLDGQNRHYLRMLQAADMEVVRLDKQTVMDVLRHLPVESNRRSLAANLANPLGIRLTQLTALLTSLQPRALFAQLDYSNLLAGTAAVLAGVPRVVLSFRNYNPTNFSYLTNDWFLPLYRTLARSSRVKLSGNSGAANADYARWIGVGEASVALIPNAIDATRFESPSDDRRSRFRRELGLGAATPVVLGVFRLNEEKRPVLFVETCARIAAAVPAVRVFVAGVGPYQEVMQQRITELDMGATIRLLGRREDVVDLMSVASVLLLTSNFEGMPNVLMEAQLVGLPVVASGVGGVPDCMLDGETGYIVNVDDVSGYARRCIEILTDESLRRRLGANGASYMRGHFSLAAMADRYLQLLADPSPAEAPSVGPRAEHVVSA